MNTASTDKGISTPTRVVMTILGVTSLSLGPALFLWPTGTEIYFAWMIKHPLTPIFMGAAYAASGVGVFLALRENRWAVARVIVPGAAIFSALMALAAGLHPTIFNWHHIVAWGWMVIYVGVPLFMAVMYPREERSFQPSPGGALPKGFRAGMGSLAGVSALVGLGLFLAPGATAPLWAWSLTPLTARVLGGWFFANGITQWMLSRQAAVENIRAGLVMKMSFGALGLLGLFWQRTALDGPALAAGLYVVYLLTLLGLAAYAWLKTARGSLALTDQGK